MRAHLAAGAPAGVARGAHAGGLAVVFVDVDQVDVGRDVELAPTELAHADDPEVDALASLVQRRAVFEVGFGLGGRQGVFEGDLGELGHRQRDGLHGRGLFDVQRGQALHDQLPSHPQGAGQVPPARQQTGDQGVDVGAAGGACAGLGEVGQLRRIPAPDALHVAGVVGRCRGRGGVGGDVNHGSGIGCNGSVLGFALVESAPPARMLGQAASSLAW